MTNVPSRMRAEVEIERPAAGSLEARASLALKLLAAINAVGVILAMFSPLVPVSNLFAVAFGAAGAGLAVLYVVVARALDRRRPWAVTAVRPLLVCLVVSGGYSVLVTAFGWGTSRVPFEGILAVWALLGRRDATLSGGEGRKAVALVLGAVALLATMAFAQPIFGWGGFVDVHERDLDATLTVECGDAGAGMPDGIVIRYDWSWRYQSPYPNERDIIVIG